MSKVRLKDFKDVQQASRRSESMDKAIIAAEVAEEAKKLKVAEDRVERDQAQAEQQAEPPGVTY